FAMCEPVRGPIARPSDKWRSLRERNGATSIDQSHDAICFLMASKGDRDLRPEIGHGRSARHRSLQPWREGSIAQVVDNCTANQTQEMSTLDHAKISGNSPVTGLQWKS